jgi:phosphatidylinositol alpha 1,6-mannosyltransferase
VVISAGRTGLLFPRGDARALVDAIVALGGDAALRARLGAAARAVDMPTPQQFSDALYESYVALLSGRPPRPAGTRGSLSASPTL